MTPSRVPRVPYPSKRLAEPQVVLLGRAGRLFLVHSFIVYTFRVQLQTRYPWILGQLIKQSGKLVERSAAR